MTLTLFRFGGGRTLQENNNALLPLASSPFGLFARFGENGEARGFRVLLQIAKGLALGPDKGGIPYPIFSF